MRQRTSRKSGKVFADSERPSSIYRQPDCYAEVEGELKKVQCHELAEFLTRSEGMPGFTVCNSSGRCVSVSADDKLAVVEISGNEVMVGVEEGMCVKSGERLGYVITGKREARSVRSSVEGRVVLVHEMPVSRPSITLVFIRVGECVE